MASFVERHDLWDDDQRRKAADLLQRIDSLGLEVIRISFVDQHGLLRGKALTTEAFKSALENGVTMTSSLLLKDTSHKTVFPVWSDDVGFGHNVLTGAGDVVMIADLDTFRVLPFSPKNGWILAQLHFPDGRPVPVCSRTILRQAIDALERRGLDLVTGLEVEFHVLEIVDPKRALSDAGQPGAAPQTALLTHGFQYLSEQIYGELEPVFDLIRQNCKGLGLPLQSLEIEYGPSQLEVTFGTADSLAHADNMVLFRSMVKHVCQRAGWHATFMCRPRFDAAMASGWHLHQSLVERETGTNLFIPQPGESVSRPAKHWIAGLLEHARESCLFSTPTVNGYKRFRPQTMAPDRIQWGHDNKGAMIRALCEPGNPASRIENRVGEPAANPYLYMTSQILSGLDGINRELHPPTPVESPYDSDAEPLPGNLQQAITALKQSQFYAQQLGRSFVDYLTHIKQAEWDRYIGTVSQWEEREYLALF
jgi:glutamine synthetase